MKNRIQELSVVDRSLSPAEATIWILASAETVTERTELRGRLVGPTCPYSTTIEVAYPFRPFATMPEGISPLARRVDVPEPSFWDPVAPFLYTGFAELWQDGECCDRRTFRHGFRDASYKHEQAIWNGKPITLTFANAPDITEVDLPRLRQQGANALMLSTSTPAVWHMAERLGFVVVGRTEAPDSISLELTRSPACLGWVAAGDWPEWREQVIRMRRTVWKPENDPSRTSSAARTN